MKIAIVAHELDVPLLEWAVVIPSDEEGKAPALLAIFVYADQADRWGSENYKGRYKVVRAVKL